MSGQPPSDTTMSRGQRPSIVIRAEHPHLLFEAPRERCYTVVGPTIRHDAIV
jgi:hypothetical protein